MQKTKPAVKKTKSAAPKKPKASRAIMQPLETGQLWRVLDMNLRIGLIGKVLVHYKLAKPNAVRIPNSVSGKTTVEEYLKKNKAVLIESPAAVVAA
jgi:hypothetical protein